MEIEIQHSKLNEGLEAFEKLVSAEVAQITAGEKVLKGTATTSEYTSLRTELEKVVEDISKTGDSSHYAWKSLRSFIIIMARDVLNQMHSAFPDLKSAQGESFDEELDVILQFISGFENKYLFLLRFRSIHIFFAVKEVNTVFIK